MGSRSHLRTVSEGGQGPICGALSPSSSLSDKSEIPSPRGRPTRSLSLPNACPPTILLNTSDRRPSQTASSSPQSTPSPGLITPTDEFARPHIPLTHHAEASQEYDLASMFLSYPSLMGCDSTAFGPLCKEPTSTDACFTRQNLGNCGCLHEVASYNVLLELSLRLRKAADVLAHSASHQMGQQCRLHQHISELDMLTT